QEATLEAAGARSARTLVFAASGTPSDVVVRAAKSLDASIRVLARSGYAREATAARAAGADVVVAAEAEVALAMTEQILTELGATGEQLDRARDRVRAELVPTTERQA
ncbi:MAG: sodium:proton exchanger, partial [Deltaproteobacteria bacterium]|nr:sodium:proton exchanger [Deltaproteobacteria bacterium]